MTMRRDIHIWITRIARQFKPDKIILFGSHAYGQPKSGSDIDLLVVMPDIDSTIQKASEIRLALPADIPIDVVVRTPEQINKRLKMNDFFIREIMEKGRVLYAAGSA